VNRTMLVAKERQREMEEESYEYLYDTNTQRANESERTMTFVGGRCRLEAEGKLCVTCSPHDYKS
jgi:hypothetical protein